MWSGAWNKRKLTSQISNRFLASTIGRARDWWSGGCECKPHWGQFLMKFILCCVTSDLSDNLTEMRQTGLSWKTRMATMESLESGVATHFGVTPLWSMRTVSQASSQHWRKLTLTLGVNGFVLPTNTEKNKAIQIPHSLRNWLLVIL